MQTSRDQPVHHRITVIGTGRIGCSLAALIKGRGVAEEVVGVDREPAHLEMAARLGFVDRVQRDPARGVMGAAIVILAVPLDEVFKVMDAIGPDVRPGAAITCTAGTTARLRTQMARHLRAAENFVPAFPLVQLAGRGPGGASPASLDQMSCLVVSGDPIPERAGETIAGLWSSVGLQVHRLDFEAFEAAVAGHLFWPQAVVMAARRVAGRGCWPQGASALTAWFERVPAPDRPDRCHQLYSARLAALLDELVDEIQDLQRRLGSSSTASTPPEAEQT